MISRGAVIKGLSNSVQEETVVNFVSKLSYGVKYAARFDPSKHLQEDKFMDNLTGCDMARDQFKWYLKRVSRNHLNLTLSLTMLFLGAKRQQT